MNSACHRPATERRVRHVDNRGTQHAAGSPALLRRRPDHDLPRRLPGNRASAPTGGPAPDGSALRHRSLSPRNHRIGSDVSIQATAPGRRPVYAVRSSHLGLGASRSVGPADAHVPGKDLDSVGWELLPGNAAGELLAGVGQAHSAGRGLGRCGTGLDLDPEGGADVPLALVWDAPGGHAPKGDAGASDAEAGAADGVVHFEGPGSGLHPRSICGVGLHADRRPTGRNSRHRDRSARALPGRRRGAPAGRQGAA